MSKPTKEAIEEARVLRNKFAEHGDTLYVYELAKLIAYIRTQSTNDALERASLRAWALLPEAHNSRIQTAIRAMKVLT